MNIFKEIQTSLNEAVLDADGFYDSAKFDYETLQDLLKQSFIKYLQGEVERLEKIKLFTPAYGYESEEEKGFQKGIQAQEKLFISDQITHLQTQIKELES